ncbi:hypothetical protein LSTR_LSTR015657 [Laodelphax striatellus]|uniref:Uncharacterized protein n=1 Tax=Laodelphax striatellus TaxID=195883 RepID=A0A482XAK2_LAOST|nr:hypothetical protein LSTR_LSTR013273 [Laodelphax striatellus]RZF42995.1 hypothetical protein LSTR_LSTR015657 [Laodelphax striatellus]
MTLSESWRRGSLSEPASQAGCSLLAELTNSRPSTQLSRAHSQHFNPCRPLTAPQLPPPAPAASHPPPAQPAWSFHRAREPPLPPLLHPIFNHTLSQLFANTHHFTAIR